MTSDVKKMAVYVRTITRMAKRLLANPGHHLSLVGGTDLLGKYAVRSERIAIQKALARWLLLFPESAFYRSMRSQLECRWRKNFGYLAFQHAVDHCAKLFNAQTQTWQSEKHGAQTDAMCMFMELPERVARRWLWYENVDFQSLESFLRRLTKEQFRSLEAHYILSVKKSQTNESLPCFQHGVVNKLWKKLSLDSVDESRMAPKSALAHNFFGFDMGFQLYPSLVHDIPAPTEVGRQFFQSKSKFLSRVSTEDRGAFEVNKETGGLYWHLYRKLRSNDLYNTNAEVRLGTWVCPWFWFTVLAWGLFLFASPIALFGAAVLLFATQSVSALVVLLGVVGCITPAFFLLRWAKSKFRHRAYGGKYWEHVGVAVFAVIVVVICAYLVAYFGRYPTFWGIVVSAMFLIPYMVNRNTSRFWEPPILGKLLPSMTFLFFVNDIYRYTEIWEFLWHLSVVIGNFLYGLRVEIFYGVGGLAAYAGAIYVMYLFIVRSEQKIDTLIQEKRNVDDGPTINKAIDLKKIDRIFFVSGIAVAVLYLSGAAYALYTFSQVLVMWAFILVAVFCIPFLLPFWVALSGKFALKYRLIEGFVLQCRVERRFVVQIKKALSANPFWFDASGLEMKESEAMKIVSHVGCKNSWIMLFLWHIKTQLEFERAQEFLSMSELRFVDTSVNERIAKMVLCGASEKEIRIALFEEHGRIRELNRKFEESLKRLNVFGENIAGGIVASFNLFWLIVSWVPRMIIRFVRNCHLWWKAMNEACPVSPPHERGIAL